MSSIRVKVRDASLKSTLAAVAQATKQKSNVKKGMTSRQTSVTNGTSSRQHRPVHTAVTNPVAWWRYLCIRVIAEEGISHASITPDQLAGRCRTEFYRIRKQSDGEVESVSSLLHSRTSDAMNTRHTSTPTDSERTQAILSTEVSAHFKSIQYSPNGGRIDTYQGQLYQKDQKDIHLWNDFVQQDELDEFALSLEAQLEEENPLVQEMGYKDDESDRDNDHDDSENGDERIAYVCEAKTSHVGVDTKKVEIINLTTSPISTEEISNKAIMNNDDDSDDGDDSSNDRIANNSNIIRDETVNNESLSGDNVDNDHDHDNENDNDKEDEEECIFQINSIFKNSLAEERQYTEEEVDFCSTSPFSSPPAHGTTGSSSSTSSETIAFAEGHANFFANPFIPLLENHDEEAKCDDHGEFSECSVSVKDTDDIREVNDIGDHQYEDMRLLSSPVKHDTVNANNVTTCILSTASTEIIENNDLHEDRCSLGDSDGNGDGDIECGEVKITDINGTDVNRIDSNEDNSIEVTEEVGLVVVDTHDEDNYEDDAYSRRGSARFLVAFSRKYVSHSSDSDERGTTIDDEVVSSEELRGEGEHNRTDVVKAWAPVKVLDDESDSDIDNNESDENNIDSDERDNDSDSDSDIDSDESDESNDDSSDDIAHQKFYREGMVYVGRDCTSSSSSSNNKDSYSSSDNGELGDTGLHLDDAPTNRIKPLPLITLSSGNHKSSILINQYPTHLRGNIACRRDSTTVPTTAAATTAMFTSKRTRLPPSAKLYSRQPTQQYCPSIDKGRDTYRNCNTSQSTLRSADHAKAILDTL